jgi:hypothetical protein
VIDPCAAQTDQNRRQRMNLVVDSAQHIPSWHSITELIHRREPVIANLRREIGGVLNAAPAVRYRALDLHIECCVRGLHVVEMRIREGAIPERSFGFQTQPADDLEIGIERIQHLTVDEPLEGGPQLAPQLPASRDTSNVYKTGAARSAAPARFGRKTSIWANARLSGHAWPLTLEWHDALRSCYLLGF